MTVRVDAIRHPQQRGPLSAIQELDGKTIFVDKAAFARAGLSGDEVIGVCWQDFTPHSQHLGEQTLIDSVLETGLPAYPNVIRQWPSRTVNLVNKTTVVTSKGGTRLIMREAHVLDPALGAPIDLLLDAIGPLAELDALQRISQSLSTAYGLAARERWEMLSYLIALARLQAREQKAEIEKSVLA